MTTAANQDFKTLFEKYCTQTIQIKEGEVFKGKVAAINRDLVLVDVGSGLAYGGALIRL